MSDPLAGSPPRYLRTPEAAHFWACPAACWRSIAPIWYGPNLPTGGRVVYALEDLKARVDRGARS
jgi:hypothetical protein